jgi:hypothetical protein
MYLCLIKNLPIDTSPHFNTENNVFYKKFFSNLAFGDDFACTKIIWMYHDLFYVLVTKLKSKEVSIML